MMTSSESNATWPKVTGAACTEEERRLSRHQNRKSRQSKEDTKCGGDSDLSTTASRLSRLHMDNDKAHEQSYARVQDTHFADIFKTRDSTFVSTDTWKTTSSRISSRATNELDAKHDEDNEKRSSVKTNYYSNDFYQFLANCQGTKSPRAVATTVSPVNMDCFTPHDSQLPAFYQQQNSQFLASQAASAPDFSSSNNDEPKICNTKKSRKTNWDALYESDLLGGTSQNLTMTSESGRNDFNDINQSKSKKQKKTDWYALYESELFGFHKTSCAPASPAAVISGRVGLAVKG